MLRAVVCGGIASWHENKFIIKGLLMCISYLVAPLSYPSLPDSPSVHIGMFTQFKYK